MTMQKRILLALAALALLAGGFFAHKEGLLTFGAPGPAQQEATAPEAAPATTPGATPETPADAEAAARAVVPAIAEHGAGLPAQDVPESAPETRPGGGAG
ncbi:MAG: hypothetical protein K2N07_02660, partial [Desulfovibrio sp.]|nr:hypothetical protein [Desulfovibrio sp.]